MAIWPRADERPPRSVHVHQEPFFEAPPGNPGAIIALSLDGGFPGFGGAILFGALLGWGTAVLVRLGFKPMVAGIKRGEVLESLVERVAGCAQPEYLRPGN